MTYAERMNKAAAVAIEKFRRGEKPAELSPALKSRVRETKAHGLGDFPGDGFYDRNSEFHWSRQSAAMWRRKHGL